MSKNGGENENDNTQQQKESSKEYFQSYSDLNVHLTMLNDHTRCQVYKNAILENADHEFKDKVVMDLGSGTGILSVFCAMAGASKVYAVEANPAMAAISALTAKENEFETIITVLGSAIEDVKLTEKVDIIVSEWMGFYLFHESMLHSVLFARDAFLKPEGLLFPNHFRLYGAPCSLPTYSPNDICGVKLTSFAKALRASCSTKPQLFAISAHDLISDPCLLASESISSLKEGLLEEMNFKSFCVAKRDGEFQGYCIWFELGFPHTELVLSTAPWASPTHWKQTIIVLPDGEEITESEPLAAALKFRRNGRRYEIEYSEMPADEVSHPIPCHCYFAKCKLIKALQISE